MTRLLTAICVAAAAIGVAAQGGLSTGSGLLDKDPQGAAPNGIAFSPDEKILYVNGGTKVTAYDVRDDDTVANLAFGDADSKTLYMVGGRSLWRIRVNTAGIRPAARRTE